MGVLVQWEECRVMGRWNRWGRGGWEEAGFKEDWGRYCGKKVLCWRTRGDRREEGAEGVQSS